MLFKTLPTLLLALLFAAPLARAQDIYWIWSNESPQPNQRVFFYKEFEVANPAALKQAKLSFSCDNGCNVFINGQRVGSAPDWQVPTVLEVKENLRAGTNVFFVVGGNQDGTAGMILKLEMEGNNGAKKTIVTDDSWEASARPYSGFREGELKEEDWSNAVEMVKYPADPYKDVFNQPEPRMVGAADDLELLPGFEAQRLYIVPKDEQGSWVSLTNGPGGVLYASDQYGDLYKVTPPEIGGEASATEVEKVELNIGNAQGLLWAFDSLYVVVNGQGPDGGGLYRVRDANNDGELDKVETLRKIPGSTGKEHGAHGIVLGPDGESLYIVAGNMAGLPEGGFDSSRVPEVWDEDQLLPRMPDGRGHATGVMAPAGWIAKTDPDGEEWELVASGFRNPYDLAFNKEGELFTYDADMEYDTGSPWYRPTRINHAVSGGEFGWRYGTGKWPAYYPDSLPSVVDIGLGSPTGVTFGYGADFPAKYQNALYALDWTYGTIWAVHLSEHGATYAGSKEKFVVGKPLPVTDVTIGNDGAFYFTTGGRRTQSELYRVIYVGDEATSPAGSSTSLTQSEAGKTRLMLEQFHKSDRQAVDAALEHLGSDDRFIRHAARIALEHQPAEEWQQRALTQNTPAALINGAIALARVGAPDLKGQIINALAPIDYQELDTTQRIALLRAYGLVFIRMREPNAQQRRMVVSQINPFYPAGDDFENRELARLLAYLDAPGVVQATMTLLANSPEQEQQIHYAYVLRMPKSGWNDELRREYFAWFNKALSTYKGGASFNAFLDNIKKQSVDKLTAAQKEKLADVLAGKVQPARKEYQKPAGGGQFVKNWTVAELLPVVERDGDRDYDRGEAMYHAALCYSCHRFAGGGGSVGPDLTTVASRFGARDLLESIIEPSKTISDQYNSSIVQLEDGGALVGRFIKEEDGKLHFSVNPLAPEQLMTVEEENVKSMTPSPVSLMPPGLLNTLNEEEIADLFHYLNSGGRRPE